jgi:putative FmdB family regulatory protein
MPTYDYRCSKCGHRFELFHGIKDEARKRCPKCKGIARRVPTGGAGLLFKGSGFYITDYRSRSYKDKARQEKGTPASAGDKGTPASAGDKGTPASAGEKGTLASTRDKGTRASARDKGTQASGGDKKKSPSSE